jgi:hypothetical protein
MELEPITSGAPDEWLQPQLLTAPVPRATNRKDKSSQGASVRSDSRVRQAGLVGIAQAREALAAAAHRAELRAEHKAA